MSDVEVPANTTADNRLPDRRQHSVGPGAHHFRTVAAQRKGPVDG
jgi:hypothetical protein